MEMRCGDMEEAWFCKTGNYRWWSCLEKESQKVIVKVFLNLFLNTKTHMNIAEFPNSSQEHVT